MNTRFFAPTFSMKDSMWRIRVVGATKGVLGQLQEKTAFLKFESEADANTAYDTLESGGVIIKFGARQANADLYEIEVAVSSEAVTH
jgi:hypothetical protein